MTDCKTMRVTIEESIGRSLAPDEQNEMERHVAVCGSCRTYREDLLRDDSLLDEYVSHHTDSVRSVEEKAAGARPTGIASAPRRSPFSQRLSRIPRPLQIAAAAAAGIAIIAGIDFLRGYRDGSVPAYASVIAKVEKAETVSYRERTWINGRWRTRTVARSGAGTCRIDYGDSVLVRNDNHSTTLNLYPAEKRAVVGHWAFGGPPELLAREESPVERLATWHKKRSFTFVRRERIGRTRAAMFESSQIYNGRPTGVKFVTWIDLETELPIRIEITNKLPRNTADSGPYGMRLRDFISHSSLLPKAVGWVDIREDEPRIIEDNFRWNAPIDTSLFSLVPPAGYTVRVMEESFPPPDHFGEWIARQIPWEAQGIRDGLAEWLSLSGNSFPDSLGVFNEEATFRTLLIRKYNKTAIPGDEYRAAIYAAARLKQACRAIEFCERLGTLDYVGKGCVFGDSTKAVCWVKNTSVSNVAPELKGNEPYAIIFGDLHIELSDKPPEPTRK